MDVSAQRMLLIVVLVAASVGGMAGYRMMRVQQDTLARLETDLAATNRTLQHQVRQMDALTPAAVEAEPTAEGLTVVEITDSAPADDQEIVETIAQHEAALEALQSAVAELQREVGRALPVIRSVARELEESEPDPRVPPEQVPPTPEEITGLTAQLLSRGATIDEKLAALRQLRWADARSPEVANHMAGAYYSTEDGNARADIFRQLSGVVTPELRAALLDAVAKDDVHDVREEAAETLADFLPDEEVQQWLEYLADNDPDRAVRAQANQSLRRLSLR